MPYHRWLSFIITLRQPLNIICLRITYLPPTSFNVSSLLITWQCFLLPSHCTTTSLSMPKRYSLYVTYAGSSPWFWCPWGLLHTTLASTHSFSWIFLLSQFITSSHSHDRENLRAILLKRIHFFSTDRQQEVHITAVKLASSVTSTSLVLREWSSVKQSKRY